MTVRLAGENECIGCGACSQVCPAQCIVLRTDKYGFVHPWLDELACLNCKMCEKSCPIVSGTINQNVTTEAFAVRSSDIVIRNRSSSGGVFSEVAIEILNNKGVVFGASYTEGFTVQHSSVECIEDLSQLCGAKYSVSNIGNSYVQAKKFLDMQRQVLFSGTPCQVAGLNSFLRKPYPNLFTIDFVCHGVPSPWVWKKYVEYRAVQDNSGILPEGINLRSKSTGWSKYQYSNEYQYANGTKYIAKGGEDLFMQLFVGDYINRESCADCQFKGYQRCSDLTLGDFWGIWDIAPEMDDNKGTSLVLVHSENGKELLGRIADRVVLKEVTLEQASQQNPSMLYSSQAKENREEVLKLCINGEFAAVQKHLDEWRVQQQKKANRCLLKQIWNKLMHTLC